jgi:hypothetical protein
MTRKSISFWLAALALLLTVLFAQRASLATCTTVGHNGASWSSGAACTEYPYDDLAFHQASPSVGSINFDYPDARVFRGSASTNQDTTVPYTPGLKPDLLPGCGTAYGPGYRPFSIGCNNSDSGVDWGWIDRYADMNYARGGFNDGTQWSSYSLMKASNGFLGGAFVGLGFSLDAWSWLEMLKSDGTPAVLLGDVAFIVVYLHGDVLHPYLFQPDGANRFRPILGELPDTALYIGAGMKPGDAWTTNAKSTICGPIRIVLGHDTAPVVYEFKTFLTPAPNQPPVHGEHVALINAIGWPDGTYLKFDYADQTDATLRGRLTAVHLQRLKKGSSAYTTSVENLRDYTYTYNSGNNTLAAIADSWGIDGSSYFYGTSTLGPFLLQVTHNEGGHQVTDSFGYDNRGNLNEVVRAVWESNTSTIASIYRRSNTPMGFPAMESTVETTKGGTVPPQYAGTGNPTDAFAASYIQQAALVYNRRSGFRGTQIASEMHGRNRTNSNWLFSGDQFDPAVIGFSLVQPYGTYGGRYTAAVATDGSASGGAPSEPPTDRYADFLIFDSNGLPYGINQMNGNQNAAVVWNGYPGTVKPIVTQVRSYVEISGDDTVQIPVQVTTYDASVITVPRRSVSGTASSANFYDAELSQNRARYQPTPAGNNQKLTQESVSEGLTGMIIYNHPAWPAFMWFAPSQTYQSVFTSSADTGTTVSQMNLTAPSGGWGTFPSVAEEIKGGSTVNLSSSEGYFFPTDTKTTTHKLTFGGDPGQPPQFVATSGTFVDDRLQAWSAGMPTPNSVTVSVTDNASGSLLALQTSTVGSRDGAKRPLSMTTNGVANATTFTYSKDVMTGSGDLAGSETTTITPNGTAGSFDLATSYVSLGPAPAGNSTMTQAIRSGLPDTSSVSVSGGTILNVDNVTNTPWFPPKLKPALAYPSGVGVITIANERCFPWPADDLWYTGERAEYCQSYNYLIENSDGSLNVGDPIPGSPNCNTSAPSGPPWYIKGLPPYLGLANERMEPSFPNGAFNAGCYFDDCFHPDYPSAGLYSKTETHCQMTAIGTWVGDFYIQAVGSTPAITHSTFAVNPARGNILGAPILPPGPGADDAWVHGGGAGLALYIVGVPDYELRYLAVPNDQFAMWTTLSFPDWHTGGAILQGGSGGGKTYQIYAATMWFPPNSGGLSTTVPTYPGKPPSIMTHPTFASASYSNAGHNIVFPFTNLVGTCDSTGHNCTYPNTCERRSITTGNIVYGEGTDGKVSTAAIMCSTEGYWGLTDAFGRLCDTTRDSIPSDARQYPGDGGGCDGPRPPIMKVDDSLSEADGSIAPLNQCPP